VYYYVYDATALARDSQRITTKIETQINNLGLSGERGQVSALRSVEDLVRDAARKNYSPIITVGEDASFNAALNALAVLGKRVPLGYIPLGEGEPMAKLLGVDAESAVVSLSRRIIRQVPLAKAGKAYFLSFVRCVLPEEPTGEQAKRGLLSRLFKKSATTFTATLKLDEHLKATVNAQSVTIHFSPQFAKLRVEIEGGVRKRKQQPDLSVVWAKKITLEGTPQLACLIDGRPVTRTPITIAVSDVRVPVIVGRTRAFV
jgi:diacylglycerol kinase family enzyme